MSAADTIQFLRDKWTELGNNEQLAKAFIEETRKHISQGGGVLWIKYDSKNTPVLPQWTFVPKDSDLWGHIPHFVNNFEELTKNYDPAKHCLMFLSVPHGNKSMFGQMVRINYEDDHPGDHYPNLNKDHRQNFDDDDRPKGVTSINRDNSNENAWNFRLS